MEHLLVLVTGGVASGKSEFAERLAVSLNKGKMAYLATMHSEDEESRRRIERHREMRRGKGFVTVECCCNLAGSLKALAGFDTVLLECLSNLLVNEMYLERRSGREAVEIIQRGVQKLSGGISNTVLVSGQLLGSIAGYDEFTESYIRALGQLNSRLAEEADAVVELVCSLPLIHKGKEKIAGENLA